MGGQESVPASSNGFTMFWCDKGLWGPTGDPDTDFPLDTQAGYLFNPKSAETLELDGQDAETVRKACRMADGWLFTSSKVTEGEKLIEKLRREKSRALTEVVFLAIYIANPQTAF